MASQRGNRCRRTRRSPSLGTFALVVGSHQTSPRVYPGEGVLTETDARASEVLVGYARCSTDEQNLTAQAVRLRGSGSFPIGVRRPRPGPGRTGPAWAAPGAGGGAGGGHLVVTELDRLSDRRTVTARAHFHSVDWGLAYPAW